VQWVGLLPASRGIFHSSNRFSSASKYVLKKVRKNLLRYSFLFHYSAAPGHRQHHHRWHRLSGSCVAESCCEYVGRFLIEVRIRPRFITDEEVGPEEAAGEHNASDSGRVSINSIGKQ
jgi:hypothetical protein